jgi:hypothetical protein
MKSAYLVKKMNNNYLNQVNIIDKMEGKKYSFGDILS